MFVDWFHCNDQLLNEYEIPGIQVKMEGDVLSQLTHITSHLAVVLQESVMTSRLSH